MKRNLLFLIFVVGCYIVRAQEKVTDFFTVMTESPAGEEVPVTDIIHDGTRLDIQKRFLQHDKSHEASHQPEYDAVGKLLDSLESIDYRSDTVFVVADFRFPSWPYSVIIKTCKDTLNVGRNIHKEWFHRFMQECEPDWSEELRVSDSLFHATIFAWDLDRFTRLVESSGGMNRPEYTMSACRIILKDYRVTEKEIIYFRPAFRWHRLSTDTGKVSPSPCFYLKTFGCRPSFPYLAPSF